jgi:predicted amidohydrolase
VLAGPGGELHRYAKIHPFSYGGETDHYAAGSDTISVDIDGVRTTPFVCYDLRFADVFWEAAPPTDLYLVVANWPAARRLHWRTLLVARAIENQAWVVGVNRVGSGDGLEYAGDTAIIDPMGQTVASATTEAEEIVVAEVDTAAVRQTRTRFPFLHDR